MRNPRLNGRQMVTSDPSWADIEVADRNGFRGLTSCSLTRFFDDDGMWHEDGICIPQWVGGVGPPVMVPIQSDVIKVEAGPPDDAGFHAPIQVTKREFVFPPNTLYRLKSVQTSFVAPTGVHVQQRLLTVTATYHAPKLWDEGIDAALGSKLCAPASLSYADKTSYVDGLDDILMAPTLSMAMEFARDQEWVDREGASFTLRGEWAYVTGPAYTAKCTPGVCDKENVGKMPADFLREVNAHILSRRAQGHGTELPEAHALLNEEEVLAVRLYSGPAYQQINGYLRAIANCHGNFRRIMAHEPSLTFSATTGHILRAIRKLAAVTTPEEAATPLYRGVRGELPKRFWLPDDAGLVCATDTAFMSTSLRRSTPIEYMSSDGHNVLWELQPSAQDDAGYHRGADISMLSQFSAEAECLFPPCTMLQVLELKPGDVHWPEQSVEGLAAGIKGAAEGLKASRERHSGKDFIAVKVRPSFI